jgi:hypothetical protein
MMVRFLKILNLMIRNKSVLNYFYDPMIEVHSLGYFLLVAAISRLFA